MATANDDEEFSNCTVCLFTYDEVLRKPKYLACHHTFCLRCIKSFTRKQRESIPCPKCRTETLCPVGHEAGLTTNTYALKMLMVSLTPAAAQSLTVEDHWCLKCKKKAIFGCVIVHRPNVVAMQSKPTQFLVDLQQSMNEVEARFDSTIVQLTEAKRNVKMTSEILTWGLTGLNRVNSKINDAIDRLSQFKKMIWPTQNGTTATSLTDRIAGFIRCITFEQSLNDSSLYPTTQSVKVLEMLLRPFGVGEEEELNEEQKDQLKRLLAAINGNGFSPRTGVDVANFELTITFLIAPDREIGYVLTKPDHNIFSKLHLEAFHDDAPFYRPPLYNTPIIAAGAKSYVLLRDIEEVIMKMVVNADDFLSLQNCDQFSASAMEVKLVHFSRRSRNSLDGFKLAFFLNVWSSVDNPGIFRHSLRSIPFGRIIEGHKVIESVSKLNPDEKKSVKISVGYRYGHRWL